MPPKKVEGKAKPKSAAAMSGGNGKDSVPVSAEAVPPPGDAPTDTWPGLPVPAPPQPSRAPELVAKATATVLPKPPAKGSASPVAPATAEPADLCADGPSKGTASTPDAAKPATEEAPVLAPAEAVGTAAEDTAPSLAAPADVAPTVPKVPEPPGPQFEIDSERPMKDWWRLPGEVAFSPLLNAKWSPLLTSMVFQEHSPAFRFTSAQRSRAEYGPTLAGREWAHAVLPYDQLNALVGGPDAPIQGPGTGPVHVVASPQYAAGYTTAQLAAAGIQIYDHDWILEELMRLHISDCRSVFSRVPGGPGLHLDALGLDHPLFEFWEGVVERSYEKWRALYPGLCVRCGRFGFFAHSGKPDAGVLVSSADRTGTTALFSKGMFAKPPWQWECMICADFVPSAGGADVKWVAIHCTKHGCALTGDRTTGQISPLHETAGGQSLPFTVPEMTQRLVQFWRRRDMREWLAELGATRRKDGSKVEDGPYRAVLQPFVWADVPLWWASRPNEAENIVMKAVDPIRLLETWAGTLPRAPPLAGDNYELHQQTLQAEVQTYTDLCAMRDAFEQGTRARDVFYQEESLHDLRTAQVRGLEPNTGLSTASWDPDAGASGPPLPGELRAAVPWVSLGRGQYELIQAQGAMNSALCQMEAAARMCAQSTRSFPPVGAIVADLISTHRPDLRYLLGIDTQAMQQIHEHLATGENSPSWEILHATFGTYFPDTARKIAREVPVDLSAAQGTVDTRGLTQFGTTVVPTEAIPSLHDPSTTPFWATLGDGKGSPANSPHAAGAGKSIGGKIAPMPPPAPRAPWKSAAGKGTGYGTGAGTGHAVPPPAPVSAAPSILGGPGKGSGGSDSGKSKGKGKGGSQDGKSSGVPGPSTLAGAIANADIRARKGRVGESPVPSDAGSQDGKGKGRKRGPPGPVPDPPFMPPTHRCMTWMTSNCTKSVGYDYFYCPSCYKDVCTGAQQKMCKGGMGKANEHARDEIGQINKDRKRLGGPGEELLPYDYYPRFTQSQVDGGIWFFEYCVRQRDLGTPVPGVPTSGEPWVFAQEREQKRQLKKEANAAKRRREEVGNAD